MVNEARRAVKSAGAGKHKGEPKPRRVRIVVV